MGLTIDDPKKTREVVITRGCVVNGKQVNPGTRLTVPITDGNYLVAVHKAIDAKKYVGPKKAEK